LVVASDLHLECMVNPVSFLERFEAETDRDAVLVLAGDICALDKRLGDGPEVFVQWFRERFREVIFVPGNHEFYGTSYRAGTARMAKWTEGNFHGLVPGSEATVDGQRFIGGTMWHDGTHPPLAELYISDYDCIQGIRGGDIYRHNADFVAEVANQMLPTDVVVTHHLPSPRSTPRQFKGSIINCFFVSDQTTRMVQRKPKLWVHGHTHAAFDYRIGSTRVYCNPLGYPGLESVQTKFWKRLTIEI
jgi:Icc-related predicted phosphoesterase